MLQLTSAITDEELGGAPFVIYRYTYIRQSGESVLYEEQRYETYGTVHPAKEENLVLLPEEYRTEEVLLFHSPVPLSLGGPLDELRFNAPDQILYKSRRWLVISVQNWLSFGFCKGYAVLQHDPPQP